MLGQFSLAFILTMILTAKSQLPNIDPATGTRNLNIPSKPLLKFRKDLDPGRLGYSCFGCNAVPAEAGSLTVGDVVSVQTWGFV